MKRNSLQRAGGRVLAVVGIAAALAGCTDETVVQSITDPRIRAMSLGILRESWTIASPPVRQSMFGTLTPRGLHDRAFNWFNPYTQFRLTDIYGVLEHGRENDRVHALILHFDPALSGTITQDEPIALAWGGVMRGLPRSRWDMSTASYLEVRVAIAGGSNLTRLHIDLGRISEDVDLDGAFNTEDREVLGISNGILDEGEDTGLDGIADTLEEGYDPVSNPDPAGDNWAFDANEQYEVGRINGTEGNSPDPILGQRPDTEDIGGPLQFDTANSYFTFVLNISDPARYGWLEGGEEVQSTDLTGFANYITWKTYWIPLWNAYQRVHDAHSSPPQTDQITHVRLWIDGATAPVRYYIAKLDIVEVDWNEFDQ